MLLVQQFKTFEGARKRAAFENAHCERRYRYTVVRCLNGEPDTMSFDKQRFKEYTYRLDRSVYPRSSAITP
jgi:hypothetical protein